jgi:FSR family fosmidomycin resistance protein-like MFS transporter
MQEPAIKHKTDSDTAHTDSTVFGVILAISFCHLLNDMMQSLLPAI